MSQHLLKSTLVDGWAVGGKEWGSGPGCSTETPAGASPVPYHWEVPGSGSLSSCSFHQMQLIPHQNEGDLHQPYAGIEADSSCNGSSVFIGAPKKVGSVMYCLINNGMRF